MSRTFLILSTIIAILMMVHLGHCEHGTIIDLKKKNEIEKPIIMESIIKNQLPASADPLVAMTKSLEVTKTVHLHVRLPRARFFAEMNQRGDSEEYNMVPSVYRQGGCHNLERLGGRVKSLSTFDTCLMLFEDSDCLGNVSIVTPNRLNTLGHEIELNAMVKSVSPCI